LAVPLSVILKTPWIPVSASIITARTRDTIFLISTRPNGCDGSFPHAAPFLPPIHNTCDRNAPVPGSLHNTSGPSLFHTEIHPFLFSSFWNFIFFDLLKKGGYSSKYPPFLFDSFSYFTAPVIPSVKLFWKQKKMIAVGIVQMNTPSISTP
jgi:hypothetical protein